MSKVYAGTRDADGCHVSVNGTPLPPRPDLMSRAGESGASGTFEWGYDGAGPAHLALAMLADLYGDDQRALGNYKSLRAAVISALGEDQWSLTEREIELALQGIVHVPMTLEELLGKLRGKP